MSVQQRNEVVDIPGTAYFIELQSSQTPAQSRTIVTGKMQFDSIKHLLSSKPLRRPNRTRPID